MKKFFKFLFYTCMTVFILGIVGFYFLNQYFNEQIYNPNETLNQVGESGKVGVQVPEKIDNKPFAMLITGIDTNDVKVGRSDTLILSIVNPKNKKVSMLSIPRDLRVQIPGRNGHDKINAAYAYGKEALAIQTVSELFDVRIDRYASINFEGFQQMIDVIGGLDIEVEKNITFKDRITGTTFHLNKGMQKLNGIQALNYARFRGDAEGDFGRMRRQQQVVEELIKQTVDVSNAPKAMRIMDALGENVSTNVAFGDIVKTAFKMRGLNNETIETIPMKSYPQNISGVSYVVTDETELTRVKGVLKGLMGE